MSRPNADLRQLLSRLLDEERQLLLQLESLLATEKEILLRDDAPEALENACRERQQCMIALLRLQEERLSVDIKVPAQQMIEMPELSFEELEVGEFEWLPYPKAYGRISAGMVVPYPPGIPLILPGEKWTLEKLENLADCLATNAQIQGDHRLSEKLIRVLPRGR